MAEIGQFTSALFCFTLVSAALCSPLLSLQQFLFFRSLIQQDLGPLRSLMSNKEASTTLHGLKVTAQGEREREGKKESPWKSRDGNP